MSAPGDAPPRTSKLDFAAVLASSVHDLKNSVGMLLNALSDVAADLPPGQGELRDRFNQLQYETMRVSGDLIQLLAVYKIDHGRYALNLAHHDVADFLDESLLQYDPLLQRRGISMRVECPQGLRWFFDSHLVAGVINNVIHNASRYTRDMLLVRAGAAAAGLSLEIEDNGPGYPQAMLTGPQGAASGVDFTGGSTGLGLYFATLAAEQHHNRGRRGYISIANDGTLGGGRFTLHLP